MFLDLFTYLFYYFYSFFNVRGKNKKTFGIFPHLSFYIYMYMIFYIIDWNFSPSVNYLESCLTFFGSGERDKKMFCRHFNSFFFFYMNFFFFFCIIYNYLVVLKEEWYGGVESEVKEKEWEIFPVAISLVFRAHGS